MTCYDTRNINNTTINNNVNTIADLLRKIDKMQRNAVLANETDVCENCMLSSMFNTKPIAITLCNGNLNALLGATGGTTYLFRVEAVRGNETVVLRLLEITDGVITCTSYTIIVKIDCICCVQCFDPINCETTCYPVVA